MTTSATTPPPPPAVVPEERRRIRYAPGSAQEQFIVPLLGEKISRALRDFAAPLGSNGIALDVGCGGQPLRPDLESLGFQYFSVDVQQNRSGTVDVLAPIDQALPSELVARSPFDFIVCTEVLEHVADWDAAFRNLARLLRPGGRMLVTCPHFFHLHEVPHDYWRATPYALQYFAARSGLLILKQENAGDGIDVLGTALACAKPRPRAHGFMSRVLTLMFDIGRKAAFVMLRSDFFRRHVTTTQLLYLSNVVVFERPLT